MDPSQASYLLQKVGPIVMRELGPRVAPLLTEKIGIPLAKNVGLPLAKRIGIPIARKAGSLLFHKVGYPLVNKMLLKVNLGTTEPKPEEANPPEIQKKERRSLRNMIPFKRNKKSSPSSDVTNTVIPVVPNPVNQAPFQAPQTQINPANPNDYVQSTEQDPFPYMNYRSSLFNRRRQYNE